MKRIVSIFKGTDIPSKTKGHVRVVCQSDTHSRIEELYYTNKYMIPDGDIYIHAGDFANVGKYEEIKKFDKFMSFLPHPYKIVIAGNHELTLDKSYKQNKIEQNYCLNKVYHSKNFIYLQDHFVNVMGLNIYGTAWQPEFNNWAFNVERGPKLMEKYSFIPEDLDILFTHTPPFGFGGTCDDHKDVGSTELLHKVLSVKPKLHVFGHIHHSYGIYKNDETVFVNASSCNENYTCVNSPIVIDFLV